MSKPRKPEVTSKRIASIAARILGAQHVSDLILTNGRRETRVSGADVVSMAGSLVTQTAPKWPALPVKAAPRLKRGPGAKPLGKYKRRVNLRVRPRPSK